MRKLTGWISIACVVGGLIFMAKPALAQDSMFIPFVGNNHNYSVTVKSSGMLVVDARIVLSNSTNEPISNYSFGGLGELKGKPSGYQQIVGRHCDKIDYNAQKCLAYGDPDYSSSYYYSDGYDEANKYQALDLKVDGNNLSFSLPTPLAPYKETAVVLSYYVSGQTTNGLFGQRKFKFSSLEDQSLIKNVSVSINMDADLFVKSNRSSVTSPSSSSNSGLTIGSAAVSSKSFDTAVSGIGYYGNWMNKTGLNIVPGERFNVSGTYSTTWFGLYWKNLLIALIIILLIILGIWWLVRRGRAKSLSQSSSSPTNPTRTNENVNLSFHEVATFRNFLSSFNIAAAAVLLIVGGVYLVTIIDSAVGYDYYIIVDLVGVVLALILTGLVIAWPIYQGLKKGINMALVAIISYVIVIIVAAIVGTIVISSSVNNSSVAPISSGSSVGTGMMNI